MKIYNFYKKSIIIIIQVLIILILPINTYAALNTTTSGETIDNVVKGADSFVKKGKNLVIDSSELKKSSNFIYNILLGISLIIAIVVGMILGIKYMSAGSEDKAAIKETLIPYFISCCLIFGAFTIWKLVIQILS